MLKKDTCKTHTFLHVSQTYTSPLFILKIILKATKCIKKPSHTNNMHKKPPHTNNSHEKPLYKQLHK